MSNDAYQADEGSRNVIVNLWLEKYVWWMGLMIPMSEGCKVKVKAVAC